MGNIDLETLGFVDRGETLADQVYERVRHAVIAGAFEPVGVASAPSSK